MHGALLDSEILADVYLAMTGGQKGLSFGEEGTGDSGSIVVHAFQRLIGDREPLSVINATTEELTTHQKYLDGIEGDAKSLWH